MKRIVLCFDGTWNTPDDDTDDGDESTNVHQLWKAVAAADAAGVVQDKWYDEGVGTKWYTKVPGGAFGVGLSENIRDGYEALVDRYEDGDEIFVFGFSRGSAASIASWRGRRTRSTGPATTPPTARTRASSGRATPAR